MCLFSSKLRNIASSLYMLPLPNPLLLHLPSCCSLSKQPLLLLNDLQLYSFFLLPVMNASSAAAAKHFKTFRLSENIIMVLAVSDHAILYILARQVVHCNA